MLSFDDQEDFKSILFIILILLQVLPIVLFRSRLHIKGLFQRLDFLSNPFELTEFQVYSFILVDHSCI